MLIIDSDAALRERLADSQPTDSRQFSNREPTRSPNEGQPSGRGLPRRLNTGVGWIEVVRPGRSVAPEPAQTESTIFPEPHGQLDSARGIALGVALGLVAWAVIGGLIGILVV
jgi:hypothetical protein